MHLRDTEQRALQRWSRLAIQLNGAHDAGNYGHITTGVIIEWLRGGDIFDFLTRELPASVWEISKLTDVDRHELAREWQLMATAYDPQQFHVSQSGLALLVAYILHMIDIRHSVPAK
jgi:hypothetical protein